jgi:hypothetical protein
LDRDDAIVHFVEEDGAAVAAEDARFSLQLNVTAATKCAKSLIFSR